MILRTERGMTRRYTNIALAICAVLCALAFALNECGICHSVHSHESISHALSCKLCCLHRYGEKLAKHIICFLAICFLTLPNYGSMPSSDIKANYLFPKLLVALKVRQNN